MQGNKNLQNTEKIVNWTKKDKNMRTINISISELEFNKFGIKKDQLTFAEFVELISRELMR
jgi:hypothetical protein